MRSMHQGQRSRRLFRPIALVAVLPATLAAALVLSVAFLAPGASADTVDAEARASVRTKIAKAAIHEARVGAHESGGENMYPKRYKISKKVVRPAEWCGVFVNYAWYKGGVKSRPNMSGKGIDQGHWATYWQKWGKAHKKWKPISRRNPAKGDAVVYGNYPDSVHVGVVVGVKKNSQGKVTQVHTVEGNVGDKVTDMGWRKIGSLTGRGHKASGFVSPV